MRIKCIRHLSSTSLAAITLAWSPQAIHAQGSVDNFVDGIEGCRSDGLVAILQRRIAD